jgi:hypothetical protein
MKSYSQTPAHDCYFLEVVIDNFGAPAEKGRGLDRPSIRCDVPYLQTPHRELLTCTRMRVERFQYKSRHHTIWWV